MSKKPFRDRPSGEQGRRPAGPGQRQGQGRGQAHGHAQGQPHGQPHSQGRPGRGRGGEGDRLQIWGFHSVREALRSQRRRIERLYATAAAAERLAAEIAQKGLTPVIVEAQELDRRLPPDAVHQGVAAEVKPLEPIDLADLPPAGLVLVLDQVTDPHNVGAILRTAAAFGVDALVTTERHTPAMTGVLAKSASGALEHVPIASVVNLARALEELGRMDYLRVGLDSEGPDALEETALRRPLALVLGAEGKGLRRLSRENCDVLARLDMPGPIKSLNVSNACAVALTTVRLRLGGT